MKKRIVSFLTCLVMVFSISVILPQSKITTVHASAISATDMAQKFNELRSIYPEGSYWNGSYNNQSWECMGWAETVCSYLFGENPRNWTAQTNWDNLCIGDHVRSNYGKHSIVITNIVGDTIYYADCNWRHDGIVHWDKTMSRSELISQSTWFKSQPDNWIRTLDSTSSPIGIIDSAAGNGNGKIHVAGWAFDSDDTSASLDIHVYIGGSAGDSNADGHVITANKERTDVNTAYGCGNNHGFDDDIPTYKTGTQPVYFYAMDATGDNYLYMGSSTVNITSNSVPQAHIDSAEGGGRGYIHVSGWAYDPDDTSASLQVHVYIGGSAGQDGADGHVITANTERTDVNTAYGCGNNHGFDAVIPTYKTGSQPVHFYAMDSAGGDYLYMGSCEVYITPNNVPTGYSDTIEGERGYIHVSGWAYDPDSTSTSIQVHVYIGGSAGESGVESYAIIADKERTDVNDANGCGNYHGYDAYISTSKTGNQPVYVYAIDSDGGTNTEIGEATVNISENSKPVGYLDNLVGEEGKIYLSGWAYDPDSTSSSTVIHVYIGGYAGQSGIEFCVITADKERKDVNDAYGCGNYHGFEATIPTSKVGNQKVYLYAIDNDYSDNNPVIGNGTVTVAANMGSEIDFGSSFNAYITNSTSGNALTNDNTNVSSRTYTGNDDQKWSFTQNSDGSYTIVSVSGNGKCLDAYAGTGNSGDNVQVYDANGSDAQKWYIYSADSESYYLMPKCSSYAVIDVDNNSSESGANIQLYTYNQSAAQKFKITGINTTVTPILTPTPTPALTPTETPTTEPTVTAAPAPAPLTLSGIKIASLPSVNTVEGMPLDITGLVVKAVYSGGIETAITNYTLSGYDETKLGKQTITAEYEGMTATFDITVEAKTLTGITITQKPDKREYTVGDALDLTGMIVEAQYNNNTTAQISDYTVSGYSSNTTGTQTVTVTYGDFTASFTVTVSEKTQSTSTGTVETPKINISSFVGGKSVTLTDSTAGAAIYYTTDGSVPTTDSSLYSEPINLTADTTIKAIAVKSGMNDSKMTSGKISVSKVSALSASESAGELPAGTIVALSTSTSGAMIYYTTDGTTPTTDSTRYNGGIAVASDMTINAIAVKSGCVGSDVFSITYTVPKRATGSVSVSASSVTASAGETVSIPIYFFSDEGFTDYRFTMGYDSSVFEFTSVSPAEGMSLSDLFTSASNGNVTVHYNGKNAIESGEMCSINLNVKQNALDGSYPINIKNVSAKNDTSSDFEFDITDGTITLVGSNNSNLPEIKADAVLTDSNGNDINSVDDVKGEITANVTVEDTETNASETGSTEVSVILAIYDREGALVSMEQSDIDLTDVNYVFSNTIDIPEGVEVGSIKMLIWNSLNDMTPLSEASQLL